MRMEPQLKNSSDSIVSFVEEYWSQLVYTFFFFLSMGAVSVVFPDLTPIVAAAILVLPLHYLTRVSSRFTEEDYEEFSPTAENWKNIQFLLPFAFFMAIPGSYLAFDIKFGWSQFGTISFLMVASTVGVFVWSEGLYVKNFYFNRWHLVERFTLFLFGGLTILFGPAFAPLFLLFHKIITNQFNYPDVGGFMGTHSRLPKTITLIAGSWGIANLFINFEVSHVLFLFFCGYSAHYFQPGVAKLSKNSPLYYITANNPVFMFLNSYSVGWMNFLDEDTALRIGQLSEHFKPILNLTVVLIEVSAIFLLFSPSVAVVVVLLAVVLHFLILILTGVNFWKWVIVDLSIVLGLLISNTPSLFIFGNPNWIALFIIFVVLARGWMNPVGMGWLDSPYMEYYRFLAESPEGETEKIHPNSLRPYDPILSQGTVGSFTFLGKNPRIQFCLGALNKDDTKDLHQELVKALNESPPDSDTVADLVHHCGENSYNEGQTREMSRLVRRFIERQNNMGTPSKLRYLTSPREFYTDGVFTNERDKLSKDISRIQLTRVDGIWTAHGFHELHSEEILNIED